MSVEKDPRLEDTQEMPALALHKVATQLEIELQRSETAKYMRAVYGLPETATDEELQQAHNDVARRHFNSPCYHPGYSKFKDSF